MCFVLLLLCLLFSLLNHNVLLAEKTFTEINFDGNKKNFISALRGDFDVTKAWISGCYDQDTLALFQSDGTLCIFEQHEAQLARIDHREFNQM